jgi:hypothetical protein
MAMRCPRLSLCGALLLLAAPSGCTKKPLQDIDAGGGGGFPPIGNPDGGIALDVGGATDLAGGADRLVFDAGGGFDGPWDAAPGNRRSFNVTSQVSTEGGVGISHSFTMTVDVDQQIAVIGTPGGNDVVPIERAPTGELRLRLGANTTVSFGVPISAACGAAVIYSDLTFAVDPTNRLLGIGVGQVATYDPGLSHSVGATMLLTGVADIVPPTLSLSAGGELTDPWTPLWLVSSEPLSTAQVKPNLISFGGDVVALGAPTGMETYASMFAKPSRMLHFGDEYTISFAGITDLAGNPPVSPGITFSTQAAPPLIAADGFESVTDDTLGRAQVLSGAGAPTINGARSLYIPPAESLAAGRVTQFAVRVPIPRAATVLRFAYRSVNPGDDFGTYFIVGSEGGTIGTASVSPVSGATTTATIGPTQVALGPIATATINLPPDAHDEVVLARSAAQPTACGGPAPQPVPGMIIDDLRAETQ